MKKAIENTMNKSSFNTKVKEISRDENYLYNLLFAGKITMREYLNEIKKEAVQKRAA
jgi:hypothetical protein